MALGRIHRYETIAVSDTTLAIDLDDQETRVVRRTTSTPVTNIKSNRPRPVPLFHPVSNITWHETVTDHLSQDTSALS